MTVATLPGREECPGHLEWSAFGASYPDSVCSNALDWSECDYAPIAELCDADDDFRPKSVPCPFCDSDGFRDYQFSDCIALWESDETPVSESAEIHFHDGQALWWTATHPTRGEERVLMRDMGDDPDAE